MSYEVGFENSRYTIKFSSQGEYEKFAILTVKENGLDYFKVECIIENLRAMNPFINFTRQTLCNYMMPDKWEKRLNPQTIVDIQNVSTGIIYDDFIIEYFIPGNEVISGTYLSMHLLMDFMNWAYCYFYDDFEEDDFSAEISEEYFD